MLTLSRFFTLLFHLHQEALQFLFIFCHKSGVICLSEIIDIPPRSLDSSLCFIQPSISHDVLSIQIKQTEQTALSSFFMRSAGLDELQAGIKMGEKPTISKYVDDTFLMAESEEEVKSLLMRVKEESEKTGLKLSIQKMRTCPLITSLHGK